MRASVLIRTKNEAEDLDATLTAVLAQEPPPAEVIVIDSGSTDETVAIAQRHPVTVLHLAPEEWNYSRALNRAAEAATGDVLVCLSAHCPPTSNGWLGHLLGHFEDPMVAGVWGPGYKPGTALPAPGEPERQRPGTYTAENYLWGLSNANSAVRRRLWEDIPFDEDLPAAEDKAWGKVVLDKGYDIVYDPRASVWHAPHSMANAFRRNRAVYAGLRTLFPDLQRPHPVRIVAKATIRNARSRARSRDVKGVGRDLKRVPGIVAALVGGYVAVLRRRR